MKRSKKRLLKHKPIELVIKSVPPVSHIDPISLDYYQSK